MWRGDPIVAARSLDACLTEMIREGHTNTQDAAAWAKAASLEGKRTPRSEVAAARGATERGLHNRVRKVDGDLARHVHRFGRAAPPTPDDTAVQGLIESVRLRASGEHDEADGFYLAAAEFAGVGARSRSTRS